MGELILAADLERWTARLPRLLRGGERRVCRRCGQEKLLGEFVKDKTKPGGRTRECSLCHAQRLRAARAQAKQQAEPDLSFEELRQLARSLEPRWDLRRSKDRRDFETALILLAGAQVGADEPRIAAYTGLPLASVEARGRRLRANGIWRKNSTYCAWQDEESGLVAFWLDCLVADGEIVKLPDEQAEAYAAAQPHSAVPAR